MANKTTRMAEPACRHCGADDVGLTLRDARWTCDDCIAWENELDSLDLEEWEENRRQRLAERQEYWA